MNAREMFDLTGKVALVTGGSRGLGLAMAQGLGELGASVAITSRTESELGAAARTLRDAGITVAAIRHDLERVADADLLVDQVIANVGEIDILVNNAAIAQAGPSVDVSLPDWTRVMDININGVFTLTQAVGRRCMIPRGGGKIVSISSVGGLVGPAIDTPLASYSASKAAIIGLTRALATEWGPFNINVNCICPGFFPSSMTEATLDPGHAKRVMSKTPLGRSGGADDIKGVAAFFCCEASRHLTGQYVVLDGGALTTAYPKVAAMG